MRIEEHASGKFLQCVYDPNRLLDALIEKMELKNDAALSRALEVGPPIISKLRHLRTPITAGLLIRMHEASGFSIRELRSLMGDNREKFLPISAVEQGLTVRGA